MKIAIVGAGMAGLSCAARLRAGGHAVELFDKGRGPGGRMSSRRVMTAMGEASFDHGAQYFTVRDAAFRAQVDAWQLAGCVAPWPGGGPDWWVGLPAMSSPVKQLASAATVHWNARVDRIVRMSGDWSLQGEGVSDAPFEVVVVAVPAENAADILQVPAPTLAGLAKANAAQPCWTVMAAFSNPVPVDGDVLREDGPIGWAARNSAKPGRTGPEAWVVQASPDWSRTHLEKAQDEVAVLLLAALATRIGAALPPVLTVSAHRWRYARSGNAGLGMVWDRTLRIGLCGDWLLGPRVECAWLSGRRLADAVAGDA